MPDPQPELFDHHATSYEEDLAKALSASGEGREFFAEGRVAWLRRCCERLGVRVDRVMDFGCGDGFATPMLAHGLGATTAIGLDVSEKSLDVARDKHAPAGIEYARIGAYAPDASVDVAYCNGVFHHIVPPERPGAVELVAKSLKPGGLFALWENNPWNPATHYVMAKCEFDADAQMLTPGKTRKLLRANGFDIVSTNFRFIFPRALRALRGIENWVYRIPLGTQYQVLARKA
jgi:trans-aconitate methyltransferase|nr:class I SAM-dependent methyltransferase [Kofleriaceae bacterium]